MPAAHRMNVTVAGAKTPQTTDNKSNRSTPAAKACHAGITDNPQSMLPEPRIVVGARPSAMVPARINIREWLRCISRVRLQPIAITADATSRQAHQGALSDAETDMVPQNEKFAYELVEAMGLATPKTGPTELPATMSKATVAPETLFRTMRFVIRWSE